MKNRTLGAVVTLWMALGLHVLALENLALGRRAQVLQGAWMGEPRVVDGDSDTCSQYQGSDWNVPLSAEPVTWIRVVGPRNEVLPPVKIFSPKCAESARVFLSGHVMDWVCGTGARGSSLSLQLSPSRLCEIKVIKGLIVNVALGKPAAQSSTFDGTDAFQTPPLTFRASADLAVDGVSTENYLDKTCAVTDWPSPHNCTLDPWWFLYLGESYDIIKIDVHGRNDTPARGPIEIRTGNQLFFSGEKDAFNHTKFSIPFEPPLIADSINISMSNCTILELCEVEIFGVKHGDACASALCENGATCREGFVDFSCICTPGFTGRTCRDNIDECSSSPCVHGSVCQDGINGYTCTCLPGYTGVNCETDTDECSSSPCLNGGSCIDGVNSFTCTCLPGFIGDTCQTGNLTAMLNTGVVQVFADKTFTKRLIFDTSASANLTAFTGRTMFLSVSHVTPLPLYSMLMVRSCHARPNPGATDDLSLELIGDGCAVHPGVHVLARRNHVTYISYEVVSLVNAKPSVYVDCDVNICLNTDWSDRCILHC